MYDIITIGSSTLDVFVNADSESLKHSGHLDICYHQGDKLLIKDLFFLTGGGGTNTAVAFSKLGLKTGFLGILGSDHHAEIIKKELKKEKISFLGKQKSGLSGYSIILLGNKDRTILSYKGVNNNLEIKDINLSKISSEWIYLSTLLEKSFFTQKKIASYASKNKIKVAANISSYEASLGLYHLSNFLKNINILILNKEEAQELCKSKDVKTCCNKIMEKIKDILVITNGENPINVCTKNKSFSFPVKKINNIIDTTGAGDAFASGFIYGIMKNKNIVKSIEYGLKESQSVIQSIGAKTGLLKKL